MVWSETLIFFKVCELFGKTKSLTLFFEEFKDKKTRFATKILFVCLINGIYVRSCSI